MKKLIINKTILFAIIMAYIFLFKFLFGDENILVAVMSITGVLMFMERDLTAEPIKNSSVLVFFYLLIGVGTFLASTNMYLAILINFFIVFLISYSFGYVLKTPMYVPFTFLYLFLLAYPVPLDKLPLRLLSLAVGALSIMAPQFLINKNKISKASHGIFTKVLDLMDKKVSILKEDGETQKLDIQIYSMLSKLKNIIHDKKEKNFYVVTEGRSSLDILATLEKLNILLSKKDISRDILDYCSKFLGILNSMSNTHSKDELSSYVRDLKINFKDRTSPIDMQIVGVLLFLSDSLYNVGKVEKVSTASKFNLKEDVYGLKEIKFNSIRLSYAFHVALEVAFACFIMDYFHLEQGRWIMYTVLSLTNPVFEVTKSKAKDRIFSTTLGAIIIGISFSIFKDNAIRSIIVVGAGYGNIYCKTYRQKIFFVTLSAIGAAVMLNATYIGYTTNPVTLSIERVCFILLGALIALIINKFIFHYDAEKANNHLTRISDNLIEDLMINLEKVFEEKDITSYIDNIYVLTSQINLTMQTNISIAEKKDINPSIATLNRYKLVLVSLVYELNSFIKKENLSKEEIDTLKSFIDDLKNKHILENYEIHTLLSNLSTFKERIIASSIIEIANTHAILKA